MSCDFVEIIPTFCDVYTNFHLRNKALQLLCKSLTGKTSNSSTDPEHLDLNCSAATHKHNLSILYISHSDCISGSVKLNTAFVSFKSQRPSLCFCALSVYLGTFDVLPKRDRADTGEQTLRADCPSNDSSSLWCFSNHVYVLCLFM